jgi:hypothetical protein
MVTYVLLCLLSPELVGQDVEASSHEGASATFSFGTAALRLNSCDPLPPCRPAGAINCVWTTYLGNYHNCSTLGTDLSLGPGPAAGMPSLVSRNRLRVDVFLSFLKVDRNFRIWPN